MNRYAGFMAKLEGQIPKYWNTNSHDTESAEKIKMHFLNKII